MKTKRLLVTLSSALLLLCSCSKTITVPPIMGNGGETGNKPVEVEPEEETPKIIEPIDTYLVLSSVGLYNNEKGKNIEEKMLENAVVFNAKPGENLPTKEEITSINGSKGEFAGWVSYEGTGFPKIYDKVPETAGKILYATFKNGTESGSGEGSGNTDTPTKLTTIYLDATVRLNGDADDQTWASGGAAITMYTWSTSTGDSEWTPMKNIGDGYFSAAADLEKFTNVIFLRHDANIKASFEEGGYWNKTGNLMFVAEKNCFRITSWNDGGVWTIK